MKKLWHDEAWEDYIYWQSQDKKTLKRINKLLQDIDRNGYDRIGKPEPLKHDLQGYWSVQTMRFALSRQLKRGNNDRLLGDRIGREGYEWRSR